MSLNFYKLYHLSKDIKPEKLDNNFSEWFLIEDFNTQKEKYTKQGIDPDIVEKYLKDFRVIKDKKYKQINDPIHGLENIRNRVDIDQYQDFHQLETLVDYVKGQVDVGGRASYKNLNFSGKPIYEDQNIQIFYADSPRACIEYKGNAPYSWCVARNDSSNLFYAYRYKDHQPAFYFVKNKEKTNTEFGLIQGIKNVVNTVASQSSKFKDKYHFFVIQVVKNADPKNHKQKQYVVTSAENDGDKQMSWEEIVQIEPNLKDKEEIFQSKPLTKEESEFYNKYKNGISDEEFAKLPYDQKDMFMNIYVNLEKGLTDEQYRLLPEDLKNKYIGFGVGLTEVQYSNTNEKLKKRYVDVTIKKIEALVEQNMVLKLKDSEIQIFKNNISRFDLNKLSDDHVGSLLRYAIDKQEMAKIIIQYKKELSDNNVFSLLYYTKDKQEMAKTLGSENINKLSNNNVYGLLLAQPEIHGPKQEMAKILGSENINKLSNDNIRGLMQYSVDKQEMAKLIIQYKKKLSESDVYTLLDTNNKEEVDKQEIAKLIIQYKKELSSKDVYYLLWYSADKQKMVELLGSENINKLSNTDVLDLVGNFVKLRSLFLNKDANLLSKDHINKLSGDNVYRLLHYATDKQGIARILGSENINKLSDDNVYNLLQYAMMQSDEMADKQEIARILGSENINKLSGDNVYNLLHSRLFVKQGIARILGSENINKLSDDNVYNLLQYATDKQEMERILGSENINKLGIKIPD